MRPIVVLTCSATRTRIFLSTVFATILKSRFWTLKFWTQWVKNSIGPNSRLKNRTATIQCALETLCWDASAERKTTDFPAIPWEWERKRHTVSRGTKNREIRHFFGHSSFGKCAILSKGYFSELTSGVDYWKTVGEKIWPKSEKSTSSRRAET